MPFVVPHFLLRSTQLEKDTFTLQHRLIRLFLAALWMLPAGYLWCQTPTKADPRAIRPGGNTYESAATVKYPLEREPQDHKIDMFMGDWRESQPRVEFGSLVLRDILTHGDNLNPTRRGAILQYLNFVSFGTLSAGDTTLPSQLPDSQEIFYFTGGEGKLSAGGQTVTIHKDVAVLMPARLEFTMAASAAKDLAMYVINEPIPAGFRPNPNMLVKNENGVANRLPAVESPMTLPGASGHWAHFVRPLFDVADGLGTLMGFITVTIKPLTLGEPHPHRPGQEEIWVAVEGDSLAMLGNQLRLQKPGMAYMPRTDSTMLHSNINAGDSPVKFLWFSRSRDHEVRK
jgi:glyoxylate utilization-related uncharacterized protein